MPGEPCRTGSSSSIAGLAFYPDGPFPDSYDGALFFADYSRDCIWVMFRDANGLPSPSTRAAFHVAANPVALEVGPDGALYYADFDGGSIRRIAFHVNQPPIAAASASPTNGAVPLTVNFDGSGSSDPEGGALIYSWDLDGDGSYGDSTSATPSHTYSQIGTFNARLRVTDNAGQTSTSSPVTISAGNTPPTATIQTPGAGTTWKVGDALPFTGSAVDPQQGTLPASRLSWELVLFHCPSNCHTHPLQAWSGVAGGSFFTPDHEYPAYLELRLTATDAGGLADTEVRRLDPRTSLLSFQTSPTGLQLAVGSATSTAPFTRRVIEGSSNTVSAPSPQPLGGTGYTWTGWSDAGAESHNVVAPAGSASYVAVFSAPAPAPPAVPPPPPASQPVVKVVRCVAPRLVGAKLTFALRLLARSHCRLGRVRWVFSSTAVGVVRSQRPRRGTRLPSGTRVAVVASRGPLRPR